eukprot:136144_1
MPVYHSQIDESGCTIACGAALLPLKNGKAPAPTCRDDQDIIDESIVLFRANVMFRNFELQGGADRTLVYTTVFISQLIRELVRQKDKGSATKHAYTYARKNFLVPGESGFKIPGFFKNPESRDESEKFRAYFKQVREQICERLPEVVYNEDGTQNKFWFQFSKRKFMNIDNV